MVEPHPDEDALSSRRRPVTPPPFAWSGAPVTTPPRKPRRTVKPTVLVAGAVVVAVFTAGTVLAAARPPADRHATAPRATRPAPTGPATASLFSLFPLTGMSATSPGLTATATTLSVSPTPTRVQSTKTAASTAGAAAPAATTAAVDLAQGKSCVASSYSSGHAPANAFDGDTSTYWESAAGNAYPQWLDVDLGSVTKVEKIVLRLPPIASWGSRTETIGIIALPDTWTLQTLAAPAEYTFNATTGNVVTITIPAVDTRTVELDFSANTGASGAQISEFSIYA